MDCAKWLGGYAADDWAVEVDDGLVELGDLGTDQAFGARGRARPELDLQLAVVPTDVDPTEAVAVLEAHPEVDSELLAVRGDPDVVPR